MFGFVRSFCPLFSATPYYFRLSTHWNSHRNSFVRSVPAALRPVASCTPTMPDQPGQYTYEYPRSALTVDAILVTTEARPQVLLIQRGQEPFKGMWALPGGFVDEYEDLQAAALRELQEETSVDPAGMEFVQIGAFGDKGRDPRGWVVGVIYAALVPHTDLGVQAADDAAAAQWWPIDGVPLPMACDHQLILRTTFRRLALEEKARQAPGLVAALLTAAEGLDGEWRHDL